MLRYTPFGARFWMSGKKTHTSKSYCVQMCIYLRYYSKSKLVVQKRARFLFLFGSFIRSIQFLTAIGFSMDMMYDVFDRTLLVASQALEGILNIYFHVIMFMSMTFKDFNADGSIESEFLLRSIIMLQSGIIIVARRINPFRYGL